MLVQFSHVIMMLNILILDDVADPVYFINTLYMSGGFYKWAL